MKPLQVTGPCTPNPTKFCLLSSELANTNWETSCQVFADVCELLLIHLQDVPPACDSGLEHDFMRKGEYTAQGEGFFYFFHPLLNILIPIVVYDQKYGTRRGIFYAVSAIAYIPFISINSFREFLGSFSGFSLGHRSTHCSFMHCGLQLYPAGMLYSWSNI